MLLRKLYYRLPPAFRFLARRLRYLPLDLWESWTGKRPPLQPPRGLIFTGAGDFLEQGQKNLKYFIELGGLQPHHHVLDIGSGIGRMAIPLTGYLSEKGRYEGFDPVARGVRWCRKYISSRFPNFHFRHIPIKNDLYNAAGAEAAGFEFPYPSGGFDFVILTSVFTHMLPEQIRRYLQEIQRVLKPGGRCYATFFLLTPESEALLEGNKHFSFPHDFGHYRLMDKKVQSANVAVQYDFLEKDLLDDIPLSILEFRPGFWCGRKKEECLDFQDLIVFIRHESSRNPG